MAKMSKARQKAREAYERRMKRGREKEETTYQNTSIFKSDLEDVKFWRVKEGTHFFDIIPYIAGKNDPDCDKGEETYVFEPFMHRNVGPEKKDIVCLKKTYGDPCPICERVTDLLDEGTDWNDIDFKVQKNPRSIYNVVVRDNAKTEKEGVQIVHMSHFTMEQHLLDLAEEVEIDESSGEPIVVNRIFYFDPEEGKKIQFKRKGKDINTEYLGHQFKDRNYEIGKNLLEAAHTLDELINILSYEEIKAILLGEDTEEEESDTEEEETTDEEEEETTDDEEEEEEETTEEEESDTEEEAEEPGLREELEELTRAKLKKYIKTKKLDVKVIKGMEDSDIINAIVEVVEGNKEESGDDDTECPGGGTFGEDLEELDHCEKCKLWKECVKKSEELEDE